MRRRAAAEPAQQAVVQPNDHHSAAKFGAGKEPTVREWLAGLSAQLVQYEAPLRDMGASSLEFVAELTEADFQSPELKCVP